MMPDDGRVEPPSITCPRCGRTSYNGTDIREKYCGSCHDFTGAQLELPGLWIDAYGDLHASIPRLLVTFGWEDTPGNRASVFAFVVETLTDHVLETKQAVLEM